MKNSVDQILPAPLIAEIAERTHQVTVAGIAQACMCHLIDNKESELLTSGLTLNKLKSHIRKLEI
ncbi:hypothetical protein P3551_23015 [Vibrio parahaemolyticus]|uniref:hypothetical protein n=1 Tax=Vibrio parahaemolyticus TaxID=670 RepID=UPI001124B08E|nr:hypothetical protein [Vibrio parahaemolyticus]MBE3985598.1 hypothetical protein [Vibrio parahaemolyticus]MBE4286374.1 hypothetical protein [Vibrio parahaemolyticus]MDF4902157.1 hypothetical protein [Vibrio parahaemolyticus]TOH19132.1 hypothetical protein CGI90_03905 [Vibrio parahaemolyticus]HCG7330540.1 hypothetical protein [Vibrio parahaemolyticus]